MSANFGLRRILRLISCVVGFAVFDGFSVAWIEDNSDARIWLISVFIFLVGSVHVSLIDHESGHMEPRTNLRGIYIFLGVVMMAGSAWFQFGART